MFEATKKHNFCCTSSPPFPRKKKKWPMTIWRSQATYVPVRPDRVHPVVVVVHVHAGGRRRRCRDGGGRGRGGRRRERGRGRVRLRGRPGQEVRPAVRYEIRGRYSVDVARRFGRCVMRSRRRRRRRRLVMVLLVDRLQRRRCRGRGHGERSRGVTVRFGGTTIAGRRPHHHLRRPVRPVMVLLLVVMVMLVRVMRPL